MFSNRRMFWKVRARPPRPITSGVRRDCCQSDQLAAVVFIQGFLVEGLRFLGDWRNLLFGALIVLAMNVRPGGLLDANSATGLRRALHRLRSGTALSEAGATWRRLLAKWRGAFGA